MIMNEVSVPVVGWHYRLHRVMSYNSKSNRKMGHQKSFSVVRSNSQRGSRATKRAVVNFAEPQGTTPRTPKGPFQPTAEGSVRWAPTSSMIVYTMCWFNLRFCKTAKILRAPLRAFDLPIMLAAKSAMGVINQRPRGGTKTRTWHKSGQLPVRLISRPLLLINRPRNAGRF